MNTSQASEASLTYIFRHNHIIRTYINRLGFNTRRIKQTNYFKSEYAQLKCIIKRPTRGIANNSLLFKHLVFTGLDANIVRVISVARVIRLLVIINSAIIILKITLLRQIY